MPVHRILGVACLVSLALCRPAAANDAKIVGERAVDGPGIELTIATPAFTAPTKVQVFLPAGYDADPNRRWPVTYYLHGAQGDSARFHAWFGDLIKDYPSIVVAPDGGPVGFYTDWYNAGAGGPPMYETYDTEQLIPLIDQRFRTIARRKGRAVIGESMGGYGVLTYAARHPDLFVAAASMSGLADNAHPGAEALMTAGPPAQGGGPAAIYGPRATDEIRWRGHNPVDLAGNLRDVDLQVRTYHGIPDPVIEGGPDSIVGCGEESVIYATNTTLEARLTELKVPHLWKDYGTGCHGIPEFRIEFTDSLPGLLRMFANPPAPPRTFGYRSIEPRFSVWRWTVAADPDRALEFLELRKAGRRGFTLAGSGRTRVTTPPFFRPRRAIAVTVDGRTRKVRAGARGRLRLTVDLAAPGSLTRRTVRFATRSDR
jgi:S-formylglutathione hydrolase FrmB